MVDLEERVDYLEIDMRDLKRVVHRLAIEMLDFKDEMSDFKNSLEKDRKQEKREWNKKWGELANKLGTIVEDIIAPSMGFIAKKYFGFVDIEEIGVRRKKRHSIDRSKRREFDVIVVSDDKIILNETKATIRKEYIIDYISFIESGEFFDYFPEYKDKKLIPIFSSLNISEEFVNILTKHNIFVVVQGDDNLKVINFNEVQES